MWYAPRRTNTNISGVSRLYVIFSSSFLSRYSAFVGIFCFIFFSFFIGNTMAIISLAFSCAHSIFLAHAS